MKNKIKEFIRENRTDITALTLTIALFIAMCTPMIMEIKALNESSDQVEQQVEINEEIPFTVVEDIETEVEKEDLEPIEDVETEELVYISDVPETEYVIPESKYYDIPLSVSIQDHIFETSEAYGIDPRIVIAMIEHESDYNASVIGDQGRSYGLMQIQPRHHQKRMNELGCTDLLNPYHNITVGIDYLAYLIELNESLEWALMAYNGGPAYAYGKMEQGILSDYVINVMSISNNLVKG